MEKGNEVKLILDTDIGSDIDDAVCLAYLLRQPRCELLGITTVSGEPERRAMLADAICRAAGRTDIPIHSGASDPLLVQPRQPKAPQADVLSNWAHSSEYRPNTGVAFLRDTIRSNPGKITLLTIGPLTNIALLFKLDPEIPKLLKSVVMMIGTFSHPFDRVRRPVEWNAYLDPHAAAIVFNTPELRSTSIGLDVTTQCTMEAGECRRKLKGGALEVVRDAAEVWFKRAPILTFHDPLAATAIFEPDVMTYRHGRVSVELQSDTLAGMTVWDGEDKAQLHTIAVEVDSDAFFQDFFTIAIP